MVLHLSVPPKMLKVPSSSTAVEHWLMSTRRKSMSMPLVPLKMKSIYILTSHIVFSFTIIEVFVERIIFRFAN